MSGLSKERGTSFNYVNFKEGKLIALDEKGNRDSFESITGTIKSLDVTDENYNGNDYRKITLFIIDEEGTEYRLGFPLESGYGNAFCCIAPNIDFDLPVKISGGIQQLDSGRKFGKMFVNQGGKGIKWYYTKDNEAGKKLPAGKEMKDRNGSYMDFKDRYDFFYKMLVDPKKGLFKKLKDKHNYDPKKAVKSADVSNAEAESLKDDLPF